MPQFDARAFPQHVVNPTKESYGVASNAGMSMREWYAGMALQGMIAGKFSPRFEESLDVLQAIAKAAFMYADAMLAESKE